MLFVCQDICLLKPLCKLKHQEVRVNWAEIKVLRWDLVSVSAKSLRGKQILKTFYRQVRGSYPRQDYACVSAKTLSGWSCRQSCHWVMCRGFMYMPQGWRVRQKSRGINKNRTMARNYWWWEKIHQRTQRSNKPQSTDSKVNSTWISTLFLPWPSHSLLACFSKRGNQILDFSTGRGKYKAEQKRFITLLL